MLCLGYDPGGKDKHGVAAVEVAADGAIAGTPRTCTLCDAAAVREWFRGYADAGAACLGIDTLLAWSFKGGRACDDRLRRRYPGYKRSVIPQNSLYSSMTINGILVARAFKLPLYESHPKLIRGLMQDGELSGADPTLLRGWDERLLGSPGSGKDQQDHEADALLAAWCAAQGYSGRWSFDLYRLDVPADLDFPAGPAAFPWPEDPA